MKRLMYLIVAIVALGLIVPGCIPVVPPTEQNEPGALPNKDPGDLGEVWNITTNTLYLTIQAAIDVASSGDTINVGPGTYTEYLNITTDNLTIEGTGIDQSIIDLDGLTPYWHYPCSTSYASRAGVLISGYGSPDEIVENVTFKGFTVKNAGLNPPTPYSEFIDNGNGQDSVRGIVVANGKNISIEYCKVQNSGYDGIGVGKAPCTSLEQSEGVTIDNCISLDNWETGISVGDYVGTITITNNVCTNNKRPYILGDREYSGKGIEVSGKSNTQSISGVISGNICNDNGFEGIVLKNYADGVTIEDNTVTGHNFDDDGAGIFFYGESPTPANCKNNIIKNNVVTGNIRGIVAYYAQECTIEDNEITIDSGTLNPGWEGIKIDGSNNIEVRYNNITGSDGIGIKVQNTWDDVESYDNNITDNTITNVGFRGIEVSSNAHDNSFTDNTITGAHFAGVFIYLGAQDNTFTGNTITGTVTETIYGLYTSQGEPYEETQGDGVFLWGLSGLEAGIGNVFHYNCIFGNADDGMENQITTTVDAECNWWGSYDGPSGEGTGTGDEVSTNVDFDPWIAISDLSGPIDPVQIGESVSVDYSYTCDMLSATLDWGDGDSDTLIGNIGTVTHPYSYAGVYTVTLTIENSCVSYSRDFQYVVVYDPTDGFVTGVGWIESPAGASVEYPLAVGKARFGFVSKYKKEQTTPTGNTKFQFKAGDLNFHSDNYDWLVITGAKAMYKGTGTINGMGEYKFMLSAIDADINENDSFGVDRFRIKIWDDTVIYDNQMDDADDADLTTEIGGGQIVIHKAK